MWKKNCDGTNSIKCRGILNRHIAYLILPKNSLRYITKKIPYNLLRFICISWACLDTISRWLALLLVAGRENHEESRSWLSSRDSTTASFNGSSILDHIQTGPTWQRCRGARCVCDDQGPIHVSLGPELSQPTHPLGLPIAQKKNPLGLPRAFSAYYSSSWPSVLFTQEVLSCPN